MMIALVVAPYDSRFSFGVAELAMGAWGSREKAATHLHGGPLIGGDTMLSAYVLMNTGKNPERIAACFRRADQGACLRRVEHGCVRDRNPGPAGSIRDHDRASGRAAGRAKGGQDGRRNIGEANRWGSGCKVCKAGQGGFSIGSRLMLSIAAIASGAGAANYYAGDNYYTGGQLTEASLWAGQGAEALELSGKVDAQAVRGRAGGEPAQR